VALLPENLRLIITGANPMYYLIKLFRLPIFDGRLPTWQEFLPALLIAVLTLLVGWWGFSRKESEFAYRT